MLITESGGNIFRINKGTGYTADTAGVSAACRSCSQTRVKANSRIDHVAGIVQIPILKILMQRFHNFIEQNGSRIITIDRIDNLGIIKAGPHGCGIIVRKAAEPSVFKLRGRTGLTCNFHAAEISFPAGTALNSIGQAIVHIVHRFCTQDLLGILCVINDNITLAVIDLGKGALLAADTIIGKGGIGTSHISHMNTPGLRTHCKGRKAIIRVNKAGTVHILIDQRSQAKLVLSVVKTVVQTDLVQSMCRHCVNRTDHSAEDRTGITIGIVIVIGPQAVLVE